MLLNRSRGELGGKPFAQHCSCPAVLRCSVGSTVAAFRELLAYGRIASIAQGTSPCAQSARRQRLCCRLLQRYIYSPLRKRSYKCRSGRASVRSRRSAFRWIFQLQKQTCQKLWPLRALEFEARLLLPSSIFQNKKSLFKVHLRRTAWWSFTQKLHLPDSAQTAFKSLRLLRRRLSLKSSLRSVDYPTMSPLSRRRNDFKTRGGSARSGQKSFQKI